MADGASNYMQVLAGKLPNDALPMGPDTLDALQKMNLLNPSNFNQLQKARLLQALTQAYTSQRPLDAGITNINREGNASPSVPGI